MKPTSEAIWQHTASSHISPSLPLPDYKLARPLFYNTVISKQLPDLTQTPPFFLPFVFVKGYGLAASWKQDFSKWNFSEYKLISKEMPRHFLWSDSKNHQTVSWFQIRPFEEIKAENIQLSFQTKGYVCAYQGGHFSFFPSVFHWVQFHTGRLLMVQCLPPLFA